MKLYERAHNANLPLKKRITAPIAAAHLDVSYSRFEYRQWLLWISWRRSPSVARQISPLARSNHLSDPARYAHLLSAQMKQRAPSSHCGPVESGQAWP